MLIALLIAALLPVGPSAVRAQTPTEIIADSTEDQVDADLADDICDADPGPAIRCTLRAAVMQANATPGEHIIQLRPVLYRLTIQGANEDQGLTGDLDLVGKITIIGSSFGRAQSTVDASGLNDRVFEGRSSSATLQGLIISGGALPPTTGLSTQFDGGGIRSGGTMTVLDSIIRNNTAARGGGIATFSGTTTILRTTITNNSATALKTGLVADGGGGVFAINNFFSMRDSTVQNNTSAINGGGLTLVPINNLLVRVERSLITANNSQDSGGGVFISGKNSGAVLIDNSTISGNRSATRGGGISAELLGFNKPLVLRASTIAGNSAPFGGGLAMDLSLVEATNVIIANNLGLNCSSATFVNSSFNLSTDVFCSFDVFGTNKTNISAKLGPLAFNGGPTRTHALLEGSPAIDSGSFPSPGFLFDQRGGLRIPPPFGNPHDIGAFELNALGVGAFTLNPATASVTADQPTTLTLTWTHPTHWRALNRVELQLRHAEEMPLWVRFTEGVTETAGMSMTNGLALYNSDGTLADLGMAGENRLLESDTAVLDLAQSRVQGSGPDGKEVTLTLAVQLKEAAAHQVYSVTLLASSDDGTLQGPTEAGTVSVGPFRMLLPLVTQQ
jgi:hypothetical protein